MPARPRRGGDSRPRSVGRDRIGGFEILETIAHGGMSTLHLAFTSRESGNARPVALKLLDERLARRRVQEVRFQREGRIVTTLAHPNVVRGLAHGVESGRRYIAMEYLSGVSLATVMRGCDPANPPRLLLAGLLASAARGLHALHEHRRPSGERWNLVHRDVSPQNVVVTFEGQVRIIDFGLAEPARSSGSTDARPCDELSGKIAYMAPEQLAHEAVDRRADIYALGVVLWEAATLRRLFGGERPAVTRDAIAERRAPPPSRFDAAFPRRLEAIIIKALRQDPQGRQATAEELAIELEQYVMAAERSWEHDSVAQWLKRAFSSDIDAEERRLERLSRLG